MSVAVDRPAVSARALGAGALACAAAGLMAGGIFDSWAARTIAGGAAVGGAGWAGVVLRARRGRLALQALLLPGILVVGILLLAGAPGGPSDLPSLVGDAVRGGRLLRPPVPFDPGWRPVLLALFALLGFSTAWIAAAGRPIAALSLPAAVLAVTAVSQPAEAELAGGLIALVALLGALAVVYRGRADAAELSAGFEARRAARAVVFGAGAVALVVGLNDVSWLFPEPLYNPASKPRKPKSVPLSEARDRVLFEVDGEFTGPWRMGVLDVYDGRSWRLPPFDAGALVPAERTGEGSPGPGPEVRFTVRDLGDGAVVPTVPEPRAFRLLAGDARVLIDPRTQIARVESGRAPSGLVYRWRAPVYPATEELLALSAPEGFAEMLEAPEPPPAVRDLLASAPAGPYERMEILRAALFEQAVASGPGTPVDVPPATVQNLLAGSREGSPFEIVAAEALLARWSGVPARIGFGFDGTNDEGGVRTVRPKNAATWLEVYAPGHGWLPLIGTPKQAKASLDGSDDRRLDPNVAPSRDIAVEIYIPVELESLTAVYERLRAFLMRVLPFAAAALAGWAAWPPAAKALRRRRRRRWAAEAGARAAIAVEYAELRDLATDLNVGDPAATPLEFLDRVAEDDEHAELAWLVSRCTYGDLAGSAGPGDAAAARALSASVRRRLAAAQPLQSRVLARLARASLREPYTLEVPTVFRAPETTIPFEEDIRPHALVP